MSGKGNCYDNAAVESFFKSLKAELVWRRNWQTRREVEVALFEYINGFYNPRRKHSALGWKSPVAFARKAAEHENLTGTEPGQDQWRCVPAPRRARGRREVNHVSIRLTAPLHACVCGRFRSWPRHLPNQSVSKPLNRQ